MQSLSLLRIIWRVKMYKTRDLWFAAALIALDVPLTRHFINNDDGIVYFEFDDAERCRKIETQYINDTLVVNVAGYTDARNRLRRIIEQEKYENISVPQWNR